MRLLMISKYTFTTSSQSYCGGAVMVTMATAYSMPSILPQNRLFMCFPVQVSAVRRNVTNQGLNS